VKGREEKIKTRAAVISIMTLALAVLMSAQGSRAMYATAGAQFAYAKKNISMGLRSGNDGVVEGSMILIAKMKMTSPESNIAELKTIIDSIAFAPSSSRVLRYEAHVASCSCEFPEWFAMNETLYALEMDRFFASAGRLLQDTVLSTKHS
jgi:hypothetical protein